MDYSHYMYLRKEVDLERIMSREDARSPALPDIIYATICS